MLPCRATTHPLYLNYYGILSDCGHPVKLAYEFMDDFSYHKKDYGEGLVWAAKQL
jgi:hypothetical protein